MPRPQREMLGWLSCCSPFGLRAASTARSSAPAPPTSMKPHPSGDDAYLSYGPSGDP